MRKTYVLLQHPLITTCVYITGERLEIAAKALCPRVAGKKSKKKNKSPPGSSDDDRGSKKQHLSERSPPLVVEEQPAASLQAEMGHGGAESPATPDKPTF